MSDLPEMPVLTTRAAEVGAPPQIDTHQGAHAPEPRDSQPVVECPLPPVDTVSAPSVSVIVTCYNYQRYLKDCLEAIAAQTYSRFDCVIVDDASSDDSVAVARAFIESQSANGRFRLVEHPDNKGQMAAFKTGLAQTDGAFVVFVDADDILFADFIDTHVRAHLNASYGVAFTCSDQIQISDTGEIIGGTYPQLLSQRYKRGWLAEIDDPLHWDFGGQKPGLRQVRRPAIYLPPISRYVREWYWSTTSAMMYRRAALDFVLSEDCDEFRISADFYLVKYCQLIGGSLILPNVHGCYRRHGVNGFGSSPVIGGEQSPGDKLRHVPFGKFKASFTRHVVANFERYVSVLGRRHALLILAQTIPKAGFWKLVMRAPARGGPLLTRRSLVYYRVWWRLFEAGVALSRKFQELGNLLRRRPPRPGP